MERLVINFAPCSRRTKSGDSKKDKAPFTPPNLNTYGRTLPIDGKELQLESQSISGREQRERNICTVGS